MLRSDYAEMAKAVHSACAAISTVFLSIRLWARKTQAKGLWRDDYLRTYMFPRSNSHQKYTLGNTYVGKPPVVAEWVFQLCGNGVAAASPAYGYNVRDGTSHGWTLAFVSLTFFYPAMALGKTAFTVTLLRVSSGRTTALLWFIIAVACAFGITITVTSWLTPCGRQIDHVIPTICVSADTLIWIHMGNAIATICTDVVLAYVPWRIVNKIYIPQNEKWAVATSMSHMGD